MANLFSILLHTLTIVGAVALSITVGMLILDGVTRVRRAVRMIALLSGILTFAVAKRIGVDAASVLLGATEYLPHAGALTLGVAGSATAGGLVTHFLIRSLTRANSDDRLTHLIILATSFIVCMFVDVFSLESATHSDITLVANAAFVLAIALYLAFVADLDTLDSRFGARSFWQRDL